MFLWQSIKCDIFRIPFIFSLGFEDFKAELGPSRDSTLQRDMSLDVSYDEKDLVKVIILSDVRYGICSSNCIWFIIQL